MHVKGYVRFQSSAEKVYDHLARGVFAHAVNSGVRRLIPAEGRTVLTQYQTKLWFGTVVTTEEASLVPGRSVTWRHVDGPLRGSVETFSIQRRASGCVVHYDGEIHARNLLLRGPLEWLFVAPQTRKASMNALRQAQWELEK